MSKFDTYFLMKTEDAIEYAKVKVPQMDWDEATMSCKEIGDGNLNYVFKVKDEKGHSVIIKQAGTVTRISADMKLDTDRNRIESEILILQGKLAPGYVPEIYFYDTVMSACGMQDLSDHEIMRTAMLEHKTFPMFADQISTFMAQVLMGTTDVVMDHQEKKDLQRKFISPELCDISERLVYTEPYNDEQGRNNVFAPNAEFVKEKLYGDEELHCEVAKLKMDFMTRAQSLIHGDLHTGSIFINDVSTKVFDPEFCFYGPMGYDIGNVIANLIFAWANGDAAGDDRNLVKGADFIYTDVWYGLYESEMPKDERVRLFGNYQVNRELMQLGSIGCKFMHCLPATRGEDVTDEVADSESSLCWDEAGNRLTAMRGLLVYFTQYQRETAPTELQRAAAAEQLEQFMAERGLC